MDDKCEIWNTPAELRQMPEAPLAIRMYSPRAGGEYRMRCDLADAGSPLLLVKLGVGHCLGGVWL